MRWVVLCVALCVGCSSSPDVVGVVMDGLGDEAGDVSAMSSPSGSVDPGGDVTVVVTGRPTNNWPFAVASWPLAIGLAEFFGQDRSPNGARVELAGDDAVALVQLVESSEREESSPSGRVVAVQDDLGDLYLVVVQVRR